MDGEVREKKEAWGGKMRRRSAFRHGTNWETPPRYGKNWSGFGPGSDCNA
jgi:hypothetical protein